MLYLCSARTPKPLNNAQIGGRFIFIPRVMGTGTTKVNVRFSDEDVWLTQAQLAEIYDTTQENISMHIKNIYKDAELQEDRTYKDFLLVRQEGKRSVQRNIAHLQNRN